MASNFNTHDCVLCRKPSDEVPAEKLVQVKGGRERLLECSSKRGDAELNKYLSSNPSVINVHENCRKGYLYISSDQLKRASDSNEGTSAKKFLRSGSEKFEWKSTCFLCAKPADYNSKNRGDTVFQAKTDRLTETMLRICSEREDVWAFEVRGRIETCGDLHAADAVYHKKAVTANPVQVWPRDRLVVAVLFNRICMRYSV